MELTIQENKSNYKVPISSFENMFFYIGNFLLDIFSNNQDVIEEIGLSILISLELENIILSKLPLKKYKKLEKLTLPNDKDDLLVTWIQLTLLNFRKPLKPFWDHKCKEISDRLPLGSINNYSFVSNINSLFQTSINHRTFRNNIPIQTEETIMRCRKIRIYPDNEQSNILRRWMGTASYVYNKVLASIKEGKEENKSEFALDKKYTGTSPLVENWERETPMAIRQIAIGDLVTARKAAFTNLQRGNIPKFELDFRRKKDGSRSIGIPNTSIFIKNKLLFVYSRLYIKKGIKICKKKNLPEITSECRIKEEKGKWYVIIPISISKENINSSSICSLDPGIRNFQTIYSPEKILKIKTKRELLGKLHFKIDILNSLKEKKRIKNRDWLKGINRTYFRISNLIDDIHFRTINFLTSHYSTILIPTFETQKMSQTLGGRNNRRDMLALKHYRFKMRLKDKAEIRGVRVINCTEEYTSKTCGNCGTINDKLGSSRVFNCKNCNFSIDRDVNGARNIMIKGIKEGLVSF